MERLHVIIDGRVQGVGFRMALQRQARARDLRGWVRNLRDGRVEAELDGPVELLEEILTWCRTGPPLAQVTDVTSTMARVSDHSAHTGLSIRS